MVTKKVKPTLVQVGNHFIDIVDVVCITKVKTKNLYVVRLRSQPNMEYPIWVNKIQVAQLLDQFNIVIDESDDEEDFEEDEEE